MRNRYSEQFRQQAIEHVLNNPQISVAAAAQTLGVGYSTLDNWMRLHRQSMGDAASQTVSIEQQRIRKLERECAHLREVNEILKKAHVYFVSNPSLAGTRS